VNLQGVERVQSSAQPLTARGTRGSYLSTSSWSRWRGRGRLARSRRCASTMHAGTMARVKLSKRGPSRRARGYAQLRLRLRWRRCRAIGSSCAGTRRRSRSRRHDPAHATTQAEARRARSPRALRAAERSLARRSPAGARRRAGASGVDAHGLTALTGLDARRSRACSIRSCAPAGSCPCPPPRRATSPPPSGAACRGRCRPPWRFPRKEPLQEVPPRGAADAAVRPPPSDVFSS